MKQIKLSEERKNEVFQKLKEAFEKACESIDEQTSTISLKIEPIKTENKPIVYFTPLAYLKIIELVKENSKEVGWHGTAERFGEENYIVTDIVVYPQIVTAANIDTDDKEFEDWLFDLPIETVNKLRFHGHSHVNMGVSPSGTDLDHREKLTSQLNSEDDFYIFMIINKSHQVSFEIYDTRKNAVFDSNEIDYDIVYNENQVLSEFLDDSNKKVKEKVYSTFNTYVNKSFNESVAKTISTATKKEKEKIANEDKTDGNESKKIGKYGCDMNVDDTLIEDDRPIPKFFNGAYENWRHWDDYTWEY